MPRTGVRFSQTRGRPGLSTFRFSWALMGCRKVQLRGRDGRAAYPRFLGVRATRHSVTRNTLRRVIAVFGTPPFAGGHARNEKRSATPVPLHFQPMPDTGVCGKPRV